MDEIKQRALMLLESMPAKVDAASWKNAYGDGWNDAVQLCTDEALPIVIQALQEAENFRAACDQLRADKQDFREEATRWAEEAGRLKAMLHDAQKNAGRYRWLRSFEVDSYLACGSKERLDAAIDAAMAAEREVSNG